MSISGFAVDLGGTKTAAARIEDGRVTQRLQEATDAGAEVSAQIGSVAALLERLGYRYGAPLGVAVAGRVDVAGKWHAVNRATLSAIDDASLGDQLRARFGARSRALNDAAAAALAEARLGAGRGARNFAYLTVSTGVGGGLVLDGRLLESRNGLAGHVGFSSSRFSEALCGSGRRGTVESVASGKAIAREAGMADARAVFESGQHTEIIDRSAAAIAALIADLTSILGLDRVAVGGSIGLADGYLDRVRAHLAREPELMRPEVEPAALGQDSGLIGALLAASDMAGPPAV